MNVKALEARLDQLVAMLNALMAAGAPYTEWRPIEREIERINQQLIPF